jgi:site-specific DNA recombinase
MSAAPDTQSPAAPLRAAAYCRVSTEDQVAGYGLPSQLREITAHIVTQGYVLAETFSDDGVSGAELQRPALDRLRAAVRARTIDVVVCHDADRLSRKLSHQLLIEDALRRAGVKIEYVTFTAEDTPEGRLLGYVKGAVAEYEREKIRERTSRGRREKAQRGLVPAGPRPFGFVRDPQSPGGLAIDPEEASVVRQIFRLLLDGRSVRGIAAHLHASAVRPRHGRWSQSTVRRILTSELYCGRAWYNRGVTRDKLRVQVRPRAEWIPIDLPAILPRAEFDRAQARLRRNAAVLVGRPTPESYLLKGILYCTCGRRMHGNRQGGKPAYRCRGRDRFTPGPRCTGPIRSALLVEGVVWAKLAAVLADPAALIQARPTPRTDPTKDLRQRLTQIERKQARLLDLIESGAIDKPTFVSRHEPLRHQAASLTAELDALAAQRTADTTAEETRAHVLHEVEMLCARRGLDRADAHTKRGLLLDLEAKVVLHATRVELQLKPPGLPNAPEAKPKLHANRSVSSLAWRAVLGSGPPRHARGGDHERAARDRLPGSVTAGLSPGAGSPTRGRSGSGRRRTPRAAARRPRWSRRCASATVRSGRTGPTSRAGR